MTPPRSAKILLTILVFAGFISIGLPDGLIGVAWPSMRTYFNVPIDALGGLLVSYTVGYLIASFSSGPLLSRIGVGAVLTLSCLATGLSLIGYATAGYWPVLVGFAAIAGIGAGAIDAGLNTYAATRFSVRMVNWLHAFYGVGALGGPILMTATLREGFPWQFAYAIVGVSQLFLASAFGLTRTKWETTHAHRFESGPRVSSLSTLRLPMTWYSMMLFFVYVGIEAGAGAWTYSLLTEARGVSATTAGSWVSVYWASLTVGRMAAALAAGSEVNVKRLVRWCIAIQAMGAILIWANVSSLSSLVGLILIGLACAPIFPSMIASTPDRLPMSHVPNAVGLQVAAAVLGQSMVPGLIGVVARRMGLEVVGPMLLFFVILLMVLHEALRLVERRNRVQAVQV